MPYFTANSSQLLSGSKIYEVLQYYYSPSSTENLDNSLYAFIGNVTPWEDPINPPVPTEDQYSVKQVFKNIIATKKIISSDLTPVVPRIDWETGTVYDYYKDTVDMFTRDANGVLTKRFYVRNKFDQVFKCLWNNNDSPSTVEPSFLPGTYDESFLISTADGYKWKFLYSISGGIKQKFFDDSWMPVPIGSVAPNPLLNSKGTGCVEVINVKTKGYTYTPGGVTITITGDGQNANASAVINAAGYLTDVVVTNSGSGYTYANTIITPSNGYATPNVAAVVETPVSPVNGHGFNSLSELSCNHIMLTCQFQGSENNKIPTDITYQQLGLILDPVAKSTTPNYANDSVYDVTTQLFVSPGFGVFTSGETIYQGTTIGSATFTATVVSHNTTTNVVRVINTTGTPQINQAMVQNANGPVSAAIRTLLTYEEPDFVVMSGYMAYIENRSPIQRSTDGVEQFRIVLSF